MVCNIVKQFIPTSISRLIHRSKLSECRSITEENIYSLASFAQPKEVKQFLELSLKGQFVQARKLLLDVMLKYGLAGIDIIKQIQKEVWSLDIDERSKLKLIERCAQTEFHIVEGSDEFLQLESYLAYVALQS